MVDIIASFSGNYNYYLKVIDYSIGAGACANVQRKNAVPKMVDTMPLFRFLPGEADEQRDYLFLVIQDIVSIICYDGDTHQRVLLCINVI